MAYQMGRVKLPALIACLASGIWLATRVHSSGDFAEAVAYGALAASHAKIAQCAARADPATATGGHLSHVVTLASYSILAVLKGLAAFLGG
jgi:hypothetical protein